MGKIVGMGYKILCFKIYFSLKFWEGIELISAILNYRRKMVGIDLKAELLMKTVEDG